MKFERELLKNIYAFVILCLCIYIYIDGVYLLSIIYVVFAFLLNVL